MSKNIIISGISSSIAAAIIKKRLREGKTVTIPSLGIVLTAANLKEETPESTAADKQHPA